MSITKKYFSPDPVVAAAVPPPATPTRKTYVSDVNMQARAEKAAKEWEKDNTLTLKWITVAEFKQYAEDFKTLLGQKQSAEGDRPAASASLKELDKKVDKAVGQVKLSIRDKFRDTDPVAQYARYGLLSDRHELPKDRDDRLLKMDMMLAAIAADGLGSKPHGTAFWTELRDNYKTALLSTVTIDGKIVEALAARKILRSRIAKGLKSIRLMVEANFPDTFKEVLREWGWVKVSL